MEWTNSVTIEAPVEAVWRLTVDVPNLPSLTPTVRGAQRLDDGPLRVGSRTRLKQPGQAPAVWTVTRLDTGRVFAWQTKRLWMTMTGTHLMEDLGGQCRSTLSLELTGPGSRLLGALVGSAVLKSIGIENTSIKSAAEAGTRPVGTA